MYSWTYDFGTRRDDAVASNRAERSLTHPKLPALHLCSFLFNMSSFLKATETMYVTEDKGGSVCGTGLAIFFPLKSVLRGGIPWANVGVLPG